MNFASIKAAASNKVNAIKNDMRAVADEYRRADKSSHDYRVGASVGVLIGVAVMATTIGLAETVVSLRS